MPKLISGMRLRMQTSQTLRGDVWLVRLDPALGSEIQKTRPAVVVSNNSANSYLQRVTVIPVTSNVETVYLSESRVVVAGRKGKAMCDQVRSLDKVRLVKRLGFLTPDEMKALDLALCRALSLPLP
jgi:mRNA interferase MazF